MSTNTRSGIYIHSQLKTLRNESSLSQEELAKQSGISIRTIQRIEKGATTGSAYTLKVLADTLKINVSDLKAKEIIYSGVGRNNKSLVKWLNISVLSVLIVPFANLILPVIIFWRNRTNLAINTAGRKIISFQLLWTLCTLLLMLIVPAVLAFLFTSLQGSSIPLAIPVYISAVVVNVYFTILFAIDINNESHVLKKIPNIF